MTYQLISTLNESINDKGKFKAIFVIGMPGAGKTYTIDKVTDGGMAPRIVNTDKMHEFLSGNNKADAAHWEMFQETIKLTTTHQLAHYINGLLPLFIDSTSANVANVVRRQGILESMGYDTGLLWIDVDLDVAIQRIKQRSEDGIREVPEEFARRVYDQTETAKQFLMGRFKWTQQVNNSAGEMTDDVILSAYRKCGAFFNDEVRNHLGQANIASLEQNKEKYLVPSIYSMEEVRHAVAAWYKR